MKRKESNWPPEIVNTAKVSLNEEMAFDDVDQEINGGDKASEVNVSSDDEIDEDLEAEYQRLNSILDLPADTYSLTQFKTNLTLSKYDTRSGSTHMFMHKFSPFSRGLQGAAIAIAAYVTTSLLKAQLWNEIVIDQILEDGDTYYCSSYKQLLTEDRRVLTVCELENSLIVQQTHRAKIIIGDAVYTGVFRPETPADLHLIKALRLFFNNYSSGILTSDHLNMSIWRDNNYNIFDAQPRSDNLVPDSSGTAKLIILPNLASVLYIILEKSNLKNGYFVLYPIKIVSVIRIDDSEPVSQDNKFKNKSIPPEIKRHSSGYDIQGPRALVRASIHLTHKNVPEIIRGHSHLIIALSALIYSRLINANKWTTPVIDLIFNQSHIYFVDLLRVLNKKIDHTFNLSVDEILTDIFLGVYRAKIKIQDNVIPGQAKKAKGKSKLTLDTGISDFFLDYQCGVLEIKKTFYALWKSGDKFYFLDPFGCDHQGFRVDESDALSENPQIVERFNEAVACVMMHSSITELAEIILENTSSTEKDPFVLHGIKVLYVKAETEGLENEVIYREPKTNRRPEPEVSVIPSCEQIGKQINVDDVPKPRAYAERTRDKENQCPELFENADSYLMDKEDLIRENNEIYGKNIFYKLVNPRRLILHASKNCFAEDYDESLRGRQGLLMALSAMLFSKLKNSSLWTGYDLNKIMDLGNQVCFKFSNKNSEESDDEDEEEDEDEDEDDDEDEEEDDDEDEDDDDDDEEEDEDEDEDDDEDEDEEEDDEISYKDISKIPEKIKFDKNVLNLKKKKSVIEGNAEPIVNIGEALERYFKKYNELIMENRGLFYGIWKQDGLYFLFNPYGSDEEGWRLRDYPASFAVTDSVNELVDLLYGVLEFNDRKFVFHFVHILSVQPNKYVADDVEEPSKFEKYQTIFLPLTDDDLLALEESKKEEVKEEDEEDDDDDDDEEEEDDDDDEEEDDDDDDEDEDEDDDDDEDETEDEATKDLDDMKNKQEIIELDPLVEISEQEPIISPDQLNLYLLTTNVNLEEEEMSIETKEALEYEKLKYNHPPPYVLPNEKVLEILLSAKKALQSVPSLVSCFSIDSKLAVKTNFTTVDLPPEPIAVNTLKENKSKMIRLSLNKYFYSRIPPVGYTPLRAINEKFIHDKKEESINHNKYSKELEKRKNNFVSYKQEIPDDENARISPTIIPLGPIIQTPTPIKKIKPCTENNRIRNLSKNYFKNDLLNKLVYNTEDVIFDLIFPKFYSDEYDPISEVENIKEDLDISVEKDDNEEVKEALIEEVPENFVETEDKNLIVRGFESLKNRDSKNECQFKSCFFAAILCILAKIQLSLEYFSNDLLDDLILSAEELFDEAGLSKYLIKRWFYTIQIFGVGFRILLNQEIYAEPDIYEVDELPRVLENFFKNNSTGIIVFENASFAFWFSNNRYYLFDPYSCDENGSANEEGLACFLEFLSMENLIKKIQSNSGVDIFTPYRIYTLNIKRLEWLSDKNRKRVKKNNKIAELVTDDNQVTEEEFIEEINEVISENSSLIELPKWTKSKKINLLDYDKEINGFAPLKNLNASIFEVKVIENDITRLNNPPFKMMNFFSRSPSLSQSLSADKKEEDPLRPLGNMTKKAPSPSELMTMRRKPFDRKFNQHSILLLPLDLCTMAWSCIHEPYLWGARTIQSIYEASRDLAFDSILAAQDSSVRDMTDGLLTDFDIANYHFHAVFAPIHTGILYKTQGWNLAMSLDKIFTTLIYTGAVIVCGKAHLGVMKIGDNFYLWWASIGDKTFKIITSTILEDLLKIIVFVIDESEETEFKIRIITISYAQKMDPDCLDTFGLHESLVPTSLPQIHRRDAENYNLKSILQPVLPRYHPIFIVGTVGYQNFEQIKEPNVKRCYFAGLISVLMKRDIVKNPVASLVDKIIQIAENLYREFENPQYHKEHIIRNVTIMNRVFDFRDTASPLYELVPNPDDKNNNYKLLKKELQKHFKKYNDGILHLTNCCYGFWYSQSTNTYYYLDPYKNNHQGKRSTNGAGCLGIFPCIDKMIKAILANSVQNTTGFFIHRINVETINVLQREKFIEDPMWVYLDYQWSFNHSLMSDKFNSKSKRKKNKSQMGKSLRELNDDKFDIKMWNNYIIEVPNLIYSIWGTIGAYDKRFGERGGKNQPAICVTVLAMQFLCNPSNWDASILDSSVIYGDFFYIDSFKSRAGNFKNSNAFNLNKNLKILPYTWTIDYGAPKCGVLYGDEGRLTLAAALKLILNESSNFLIKCANAVIGVLSKPDGYYVVDPGWTGPPLFQRHHGAIYALRCRNINALVYAITKIINTNQREEFFILPLKFYFKQSCNENQMSKTINNKLFNININTNTYPSVVKGCRKNLSIAGNEDIYTRYRNNVKRGLGCKSNGENSHTPSLVPQLNAASFKNVTVSTDWHKNIGKRRVNLQKNNSKKQNKYASKFLSCDDYPKVIDFLNNKPEAPQKTKKFFSKQLKQSDEILQPIDYYRKRKFLSDKSKREFKMQIKDMSDDYYKNYRHRVAFNLNDTIYHNDNDGGNEEEKEGEVQEEKEEGEEEEKIEDLS